MITLEKILTELQPESMNEIVGAAIRNVAVDARGRRRGVQNNNY
jgi:hypothetical protein